MAEPNQPIFYVMVGLPGSGKSTVADEWINMSHLMAGAPYPVTLSTDNYIQARAVEQGLTYSDVFSSEIDAANKWFNEAITAHLKQKVDILIDRTNVASKGRKSLLRRVPSEYMKVAVVCNRPDEEEHHRRLADRPGKIISWKIVEDMASRYEEPTLDEGFDYIIFFE